MSGGAERDQLDLFAAAGSGGPESDPGGDPPGDPPGGGLDPAARDALERDRAARLLAQTEFSRPLLVEAGAGTGKTTTLTARLLAWSLGPGWTAAAQRVREREAARRPLAGEREPSPEAVAAETLSGVVAITFTEAAAAEMARRAGQALADLARTAGHEPPPWLTPEALPPEPERSRRSRALLGSLDHLVVRTIHAFCRSLLAAHPLEAGLHPELEVDADGARVEEIAREVVEDRLRSAYGAADGGEGDPDLLALAERGIGPADLVEAAVALVQAGLPAAALETPAFAPERVRELREGVARAGRELEAAAGGRLDGATRSKKTLAALEALRATLRAAGEAAGDDLEGFAAFRTEVAAAWEGSRDRLRDWGRGRLNKTEGELLADVAGAVVEAAAGLSARIEHLITLDPAGLEHARRALAPAVAEVRREMRRRGVVTFTDLLAEARALLVARPGVAARVRRRIDQLLVDELQDTDRLQCDVVGALGLEGPPDERPGLFLVGDPKQSIYGWRSADLRAYDALRRRVEAAGGLRLTLSENFRSVPAILDEVARTVEPVMVERPGLQPRFEPLVACGRLAAEPGFARAPWAPIEHWVSWRAGDSSGPGLADTRSGDATRLEAEAIARDLARLHREAGLPWGEAAILLRAFSDLDDYLDALRRHGVPFAVTGDRQYYRRREVIDAAALVRAVLDPGDHLALLTLLRSPAVGVPDAALVPLWAEGFPRRMSELAGPDAGALEELRAIVERAAARLPPASEVPGLDRIAGWDGTLLAAVHALALLRRDFATEPADRFVERLRRRLPLEAVAAARYLGRYRLANLERFFRRLGAAMESSAGDVTAVLRALRRGVAEALAEEEGQLQGAAGDAVQVMTIHKAKGLDFGHVYLPQLHKTPPPESLPSIAVREVAPYEDSEDDEGADGGERRLEYCLFGAPTPGWAAVAEEERRVAAAERVRTLYVAMTRAKSRLVLAGAWPEAPVPRPPAEARSYVDLLGERFRALASVGELWERAQAGIDQGRGGEAGRLDAQGTRWVFPARLPEPEEEGEEAASDEESPAGEPADAAEVAAASERLLERRRRADRRSRRPLGGAVSAEAHRRLEALAERRFEASAPAEDDRTAEDDAPERLAARAAGSAVHRLLEELDLEEEVSGQVAAARERLAERVRPYLPAGVDPTAAAETADEVLDRLVLGPLLAHLAEIGDRVVARELPVLLPPLPPAALPEIGPEAAPGTAGERPLGFLSGAVDLLYQEEETGALVVADYKTDRVEDDEAVRERAAAYAPQATLYARAVQEALGLPEPPRAELWFLWPGRIERL